MRWNENLSPSIVCTLGEVWVGWEWCLGCDVCTLGEVWVGCEWCLGLDVCTLGEGWVERGVSGVYDCM